MTFVEWRIIKKKEGGREILTGKGKEIVQKLVVSSNFLSFLVVSLRFKKLIFFYF